MCWITVFAVTVTHDVLCIFLFSFPVLMILAVVDLNATFVVLCDMHNVYTACVLSMCIGNRYLSTLSALIAY